MLFSHFPVQCELGLLCCLIRQYPNVPGNAVLSGPLQVVSRQHLPASACIGMHDTDSKLRHMRQIDILSFVPEISRTQKAKATT